MYQRPSVDAVRVKQACGLSTLAVAAMAAAECGDPPVEIIPEQRYDSAGITVVVSHTPPARRVLSAEPRARIGVVSGDSAYLFYTVSGAHVGTHVLATESLAPGPQLRGRFDRGHLMAEIRGRPEPAGVDDRGIVVYSGNKSWGPGHLRRGR